MAGRVIVVGGANVDVKARSLVAVVAGSSNPGRTVTSPGGVARNVAENLARLGTAVELVAAVGRDAAGEALLAATAAAGVGVGLVHDSGYPTGSYTAVLEAAGEMLVAVADMTATEAFAPADLAPSLATFRNADIVVVDANLAPETLGVVVEAACDAGRRVVIEPVSVAKAARLRPLVTRGIPLFAITPNRDELAAVTGSDVPGEAGAREAAAVLHAGGVAIVWVRLGAAGSLLFRAGREPVALSAVPGPVVDVTGAGDAMLAAFVHAVLDGHDPVEAARYGHAAAALTLAVASTVRADLTWALLEAARAAVTESPGSRP